jgi:hypothetical protein
MIERAVILIQPDGTETVLCEGDQIPGDDAIKKAIDGPLEFVRVLRQEDEGFTYTWMIGHEMALIEKLPRNQKATDLYLANVRRAYPDHPQPWKAAEQAMRRDYEALVGKALHVESLAPDGYDEDPYVAGPVIWFKGWTCQALERAGL